MVDKVVAGEEEVGCIRFILMNGKDYMVNHPDLFQCGEVAVYFEPDILLKLLNLQFNGLER